MSEADKKTFKRKFISLELKMQILDRLDKGEKATHIAKSLDMHEATIRTIKKNEELIRSSVAAGSCVSTKYSFRARAPIIGKMEKALRVWMEVNSRKRIPMDNYNIQQKGMKIYQHLKENGGGESSAVHPADFLASKGWLDKFKKRFGISSLKIKEENVWADHETAKNYPQKIRDLIEERGYVADQIFNAAETGLCWKKMPSRTFISNHEKSADNITLLLCSNASGDLMTKPMLVSRSLNPRALKNVNKTTLPVYWKSSSKVWVTGFLFKDWFLNCFVPEVKKYLREKKLDFKVLLLLDNAPGHPKDLHHPNVEIEFLPPNTSVLLQPMDRGVIYTFKIYYVRALFRWILDLTDAKSIRPKEAWKQFTIADCVQLIAASLKEVKTAALNGGWKTLWSSAVEAGNELDSSDTDVGGLLEVARAIEGAGFEDMAFEDVRELLVEEEDGLDEAELIELVTGDVNQMNGKDDFTLKKLQEGLNIAEALEAFFLSADPSAERSQNFKRKLKSCLSEYRQVYDELVKSSKKTKVNDGPLKKRSLLALLSSSDDDES